MGVVRRENNVGVIRVSYQRITVNRTGLVDCE